jgi:2'-5' RNA ligase
MRVFAALPLPAETSASIVDAFSSARGLAPKVKWVAAEGLHLTLHFFGEIPDEAVSGFWPLFDDPGLRVHAIRAQLGALGFFPSTGNPRVLWIGLQKGIEEIQAFWKEFTERLDPLRLPAGPLHSWSPGQSAPSGRRSESAPSGRRSESAPSGRSDGRGFVPHITVARAGSTPLSAHWAQVVSVPQKEFLITECVLFQSMLGTGGARYVPLRTIPFQRGAS